MRRIGICALLLLWLLSALPGVTWADGEIELASEAAILMDAGTGQILYAKNVRERLYPASITKVMTGLLALEALDAGQMLTVSQEAVNQVPRTSSHISLQPGEELTVADAMYALAISSANDAANVLAEGVSGRTSAQQSWGRWIPISSTPTACPTASTIPPPTIWRRSPQKP